MKKIFATVKKIFVSNKTIELFSTSKEPALAELGGNYCSDSC